MKSKYSKSKIAALTLTFVCATTAMASATTLQYGDKGRNVIAVQQQLIKHGYNATDYPIMQLQKQWQQNLLSQIKMHNLDVLKAKTLS